MSVQIYSVQYNGYNLIGVTTVEEAMAAMTALVYSGLHTRIYRGMYRCTNRLYAGTRGGEQIGSPQGIFS
jgi:hypothetical protein